MPYTHRADQRASEARWKERNPELARKRNAAYSRKYYALNKNNHRRRDGNRRRNWYFERYGITQEVKGAIWESQNKLCAICLKPTDKPQTDHQEEPFKIRGILCITCNTTLGKFQDDPAMFRKMAEYLETAQVDLTKYLGVSTAN